MTIGGAIRAAAARLSPSPTAMLDARVLMMSALDCDEAELIARNGRTLPPDGQARFDAMIARRIEGEPVAHIVGRREFWSLEIEVEPGILVPRNDSETLIEAVVRRRRRDEPLQIVDLGCGSGALLCALLSEFPQATGLAVDLNEQAVTLTARNLANLGFADRASVSQADWLHGVEGWFDVIVANPPYIPDREYDRLPREVGSYESPLALFAGGDGLDAIRRILSSAPERLTPDGLVVVEFGEGQADSVKELARNALPDAALSIEKDLGGRPRAIVADGR